MSGLMIADDPHTAAAATYTVSTWPNGLIPLEFDGAFPADKQALVYQACREWEEAAGVRCRPRAGEAIYIRVTADSRTSCLSTIGAGNLQSPGSRPMNLFFGCWSYQTLLHELGHAIGLNHEHQRPDRDSHIQIFSAEMGTDSGTRGNWDRLPGIDTSLPYDPLSVMHYSVRSASIRGNAIFLPVDRASHVEIMAGSPNRVSDLDAEKVRQLYGTIGTGRRDAKIDARSVSLVSASSAQLSVEISGQFLPTGNAVEVAWMDSYWNFFTTPGVVQTQSPTKIRFQIPAFGRRMPAWIRVMSAAQPEGTYSAPVHVVFPASLPPAGGPGVELVPAPAAASRTVNGASYLSLLSAGALASVFRPTTSVSFNEANVQLRQNGGSWILARVVATSLGQINFEVPSLVTPGPAELQVIRDGAVLFAESVIVRGVAPGIFTPSMDGRGYAIAQTTIDGREYFPTYQGEGAGVQPIPIEVDRADGRPVYLVVYLTGVRGRTDLRNVRASLGGKSVPVLYAGAQPTYIGLDQLNLSLPASLAGLGLVDLQVSADGIAALPVKLWIQ